MATSIRHDDKFIEKAQVYATVNKRSVPKQIEHWAEIGMMMEDNPDLTYEFIKDALIAKAEYDIVMNKREYIRGEDVV